MKPKNVKYNSFNDILIIFSYLSWHAYLVPDLIPIIAQAKSTDYRKRDIGNGPITTIADSKGENGGGSIGLVCITRR